MNIKLKPFLVPNFLRSADDREICFPLKSASPEELSELCDQFRKWIFEKAEKKDPKVERGK